MSNSHLFNVERVRQFEVELAKKLEGLSKIENDILIVGQQRKDWLDNISISEKADTLIYTKKMELLKAQAELSALQMSADILKMEGHYEVQSLNYLIEATKPLDHFGTAEEELEAREQQLQKLARRDNQMIASSLLESIELRSKLGNYNYDLTSQLSKLKHIVEAEQISKVEETQEKLLSYIELMYASCEESKALHKKITSEYLILRHNSRVAKEILLRSQNEAHLLREELQSKVEVMTTQAEMQHQKMEESSRNEIKVLTSDLRAKVMAREAEYEVMQAKVKKLSKMKMLSFKQLKKEVREYDKKYNELQKSRKHDITEVTSELKRLRQMIDIAQHKLSLSIQFLDNVKIDAQVEAEMEEYLRGTHLADDDDVSESSAVQGRDGTVNHVIVKKLKEKLKDVEWNVSRSGSLNAPRSSKTLRSYSAKI